MMATKVKRASLAELKKFADRVRAAGGGNPLDALMPAVPEDASQCLIAKNLNFNCNVDGIGRNDQGVASSRWGMHVEDSAIRNKIAEALGLPIVTAGDYEQRETIVLPEEIGQVASDFDEVTQIAYRLTEEYRSNYGLDYSEVVPRLKQDEVELFNDLWPYVEESTREAYDLADRVTEDGQIIL